VGQWVEIVHVWILGLAGLGGAGLWSGYCPGLWKLRGPMGWGLACTTSCYFSILWHGETFHELEAQSADVSALPGALPQPSVSPAS
jgi:hypothetical protein